MSDITKPKFLHILRNPYGFTNEQVKQARLDACTAYELMETACKLMESTETGKQTSKAKLFELLKEERIRIWRKINSMILLEKLPDFDDGVRGGLILAANSVLEDDRPNREIKRHG